MKIKLNLKNSLFSIATICTMFLAMLLPLKFVLAEGVNLIANPSLSLETNNSPTDWTTNSWGENQASFSYQNSGRTDNRSLAINMTSRTSGDAKWMPSSISVVAGHTYEYTDYSLSDVPTELDVAYTNLSGEMSFEYLTTISSSSDWQKTSAKFTVPEGIVSLSVYHIIYSVGNLQLDDVSLVDVSPVIPPTDPEPQPTSLIPNASLETSDNNLPSNWQQGSWGNNNANFNYVTNDAHQGNKSAKVTLSNYVDGDAKWYFAPINNLTPGEAYKFSAWYKTDIQPHVVAMYYDNSGTERYFGLPTPTKNASSANTWQEYQTILNVPSDAVSLTVFFLINSNGWLQTDDYSLNQYVPIGFDSAMISLTFDDGWASIYNNGLPLLEKYNIPSTQYIVTNKLNTPDYMTNAMIKQFLQKGHEIDSHTVSHANLTLLTTSQRRTELRQSQNRLRRLFGNNTAKNLATPYGAYDANVIKDIKKYYQSHRSVDTGYNTKDNFDPYNILVQNIETDTTPAEVASWVAKAKQEKSWLVLVYHTVNNSTSLDDYAVSPANLEAELQIIQASGVPVKTMNQALTIAKQQK